MKKLLLRVNGEPVREYDRGMQLEESQLAYLDKMDSDMAHGIKIRGELITNPDSQQCARFVAMNLVKALQQGNEAAASASFAYLAQRIPSLLEIHANDQDGAVNIEFVEEQAS